MQPENGGTEKTETADEPEAENEPASVARDETLLVWIGAINPMDIAG
jgi:hypothetical protein